MQLKTILNQCHKFKSFVYDQARLVNRNGKKHIEVDVVPRRNSKAMCSGCERPARLYDRLNERHFEFIPLWGYRVFLVYLMRPLTLTGSDPLLLTKTDPPGLSPLEN